MRFRDAFIICNVGDDVSSGGNIAVAAVFVIVTAVVLAVLLTVIMFCWVSPNVFPFLKPLSFVYLFLFLPPIFSALPLPPFHAGTCIPLFLHGPFC